MTEDEAKTMYCMQKDHGADRCTASKCMAWRWLTVKPAVKAWDAAEYTTTSGVEFDLPTQPFDGYCGLAGKPGYR